jgi:hypothetical protein
MVRRFLLPAFAVAAMLMLSATSAEAKMFKNARTHGDACEAYAGGDAVPTDCGCGGGSSCDSCDSCCEPKCGHRLRDLFHRCCKPTCCEPVSCEPARYTPKCYEPKCCKPVCCEPVCCKPVRYKPKCCKPVCCDPCDSCGSCCRHTPIRDLFAGLRDAFHSCCNPCCDSCGCDAPVASCGCGH